MKNADRIEIVNWLNDPEKTAKKGIMLYAEHGVNINIMRKIKRISDERAIGLLETQFKKLLGMSILPEQIDADAKKVQRDVGPVHNTNKEVREKTDPFPKKKSRPKELVEIYKEKDKLYVKAKNLNSMLIAKGDEMDQYKPTDERYLKLKAERKKIAKEVIELFNEINKQWKLIDYYAEHGKLPEPEMMEPKAEIKADVDDPVALDKRYRTLSTYISKAKKKPERNQDKLKELYAESNAIAEKLNTIYGEGKYKIREYEAADKSETKTK